MENKQIKISVIVPCYKVEQFLENCVNSILSSTFKDFEIILVDDGSPDKSGELADELAKRDNRIHVIHKQNGGVVKARETGVEAAQGEWITLVDSDDSITPYALEDLYYASIGKDTDLVLGFPVGMKFPQIPEKYGIEEYRTDIISGTRIQAAPWGRLIRKSIIIPFLFDIPRKVRLGDDMIFNIRCAFATDKAPVIVNSYVYDYFTNEESITNTNKRDPEYEQYFHEMRLLSIPVKMKDKYLEAMIYNRFHPVQQWSYASPFSTSWLKSDFVTNLKDDIKRCHYPISLKQRVLISTNFIILRGFLILCFRLAGFLKRRLLA